jgi:hypothetical protein
VSAIVAVVVIATLPSPTMAASVAKLSVGIDGERAGLV